MSELPQIPNGFRKHQRNGMTEISWRFDRNWFAVLGRIFGIFFLGFVIWRGIIPELLKGISADVELSQWEVLLENILTSEFWSNNYPTTLGFGLFLLLLLLFICLVTVQLLNRSTLRFSPKTVTHTHGPIPYIPKRKLQTADIDHFYKKKSPSGRERYALFAKLHNNKRIKLVTVSYSRRTSHGIDYLVTELNVPLDY